MKPKWEGITGPTTVTFSILERIELGETKPEASPTHLRTVLSVSSNGSNWVKQILGLVVAMIERFFQYPPTDRSG